MVYLLLPHQRPALFEWTVVLEIPHSWSRLTDRFQTDWNVTGSIRHGGYVIWTNLRTQGLTKGTCERLPESCPGIQSQPAGSWKRQDGKSKGKTPRPPRNFRNAGGFSLSPGTVSATQFTASLTPRGAKHISVKPATCWVYSDKFEHLLWRHPKGKIRWSMRSYSSLREYTHVDPLKIPLLTEVTFVIEYENKMLANILLCD